MLQDVVSIGRPDCSPRMDVSVAGQERTRSRPGYRTSYKAVACRQSRRAGTDGAWPGRELHSAHVTVVTQGGGLPCGNIVGIQGYGRTAGFSRGGSAGTNQGSAMVGSVWCRWRSHYILDLADVHSGVSPFWALASCRSIKTKTTVSAVRQR